MSPTPTLPSRFALSWTWAVPALALITLAASFGRELSVVVALLLAAVLGAAVVTSVHHAEVIAHRVGEPFGSLVLALAVTIIEVALIVTLMLSGGDGTETLARDTVFSAVMISCNGIIGLSLLVGSAKHGTVLFNSEGSAAALATVATLAGLALALPSFTSTPGPVYSPGQLAFAAVASLAVYVLFVTTQTVRHRDFFLPIGPDGEVIDEAHADPPTNRETLISVGLLVASLVAVVGLAKVESHSIEQAVAGAGLHHSFVGVVIALVVLAPETTAALRAARHDRTQTSVNLAYGSAIASIGLTIPALAVLTIFLDVDLHLGLGPLHLTLLALTLIVGALTVVPGRGTRLQGGLHVVLVAAYIFLAASP